MIHIKAVLAEGGGVLRSCVGSANLKKNSFDSLGEFNGLIYDHELNIQLQTEVKAIKSDCRPYSPTPYKKLLSHLEEFFG